MPNRSSGASDFALLLLLATIWGSSFLFIKYAVEGLPAATMTAGRLTIAAVLLIVVARMAGQTFNFGRKAWLAIFGAAWFGNSLPFVLIAWGEEVIDSGLAAILMAVMPISTVVLAHIFTADEKLNVRKVIGVLFGLSGLVILIGPEKLLTLGDNVVRQMAVAGAAFCYGINAVITKSLMGLPRRALAGAIFTVSVIMTLPAVIIMDWQWLASSVSSTDKYSILAMVVLGVLHTACATLLMFALVKRRGASYFSQINFLVPLLGVGYGALLLAERPEINAYVALVVILIGIAIVRSAQPTK